MRCVFNFTIFVKIKKQQVNGIKEEEKVKNVFLFSDVCSMYEASFVHALYMFMCDVYSVL